MDNLLGKLNNVGNIPAVPKLHFKSEAAVTTAFIGNCYYYPLLLFFLCGMEWTATC